MKIGILTFHWATNYGAVLQAYALQEFLKNKGHEVEIIHYVPYTSEKNFLRCFRSKRPSNIYKQILALKKEQKIKPFRKKHLHLSDKYQSLEELNKKPPIYDAYIVGSDQVWNPYFLANGENRITPSYFLSFIKENRKKTAYAVSFGVEYYPQTLKNKLKELSNTFHHISVREQSGIALLERLKVKNIKLMPDPCLLMSKEMLRKILSDIKEDNSNQKEVCIYTLQKRQTLIKKTQNYLNKQTGKNQITIIKTHSVFTIENWLKCFQTHELIITNSFHGVVFSILFNKKFIAIPIEGKLHTMNDRIYSLLAQFNLTDKILESFDTEKIEKIRTKEINWHLVEEKRKELTKNADNFLYQSLL